jgi:hypothetical protein
MVSVAFGFFQIPTSSFLISSAFPFDSFYSFIALAHSSGAGVLLMVLALPCYLGRSNGALETSHADVSVLGSALN